MRGVTCLLCALVALAGCSDADLDPQAANPGASHDAPAPAGVLTGVVVDAAVSPIEGASMRLAGSGGTWNGTTDAEGHFRLGPAPAGAYVLRTDAPRRMPSETVVAIRADAPTAPMRVVLEHEPSAAPFVEAVEMRGYMDCDTTVGSPCGTVNWAVGQQVLNHHDRDEWRIRPGPQWVQAEMVWDSTQPLSDDLRLILDHVDAGGNKSKLGWSPLNEGTSPLMIAANETGHPVCHAVECEDDPVDMETWATLRLVAWTGDVDATRPPDAGCDAMAAAGLPCTGAGLSVQQDFTIYAHVFYNQSPERGWRFTSDGAA